ncbi:DUF6173 family protein [Kordiimonas gwangyangensis]|uniref:DUF6173 family protein n=1 Tax=Kordiimonas gwangyangensis TaxID=288022 RepID=UPI000364A516|nr:DUF6173 family protein [Kordiimonas gwangyangensis]
MSRYDLEALSRTMKNDLEEITRASARRNNPAQTIFDDLEVWLRDFEETLEHGKEVGMRMLAHMSSEPIHIRTITYSNPHLIIFDGLSAEGNRVRLVQHVSQLNVALVAVESLAEEPFKVGFEIE